MQKLCTGLLNAKHQYIYKKITTQCDHCVWLVAGLRAKPQRTACTLGFVALTTSGQAPKMCVYANDVLNSENHTARIQGKMIRRGVVDD